MGMLDLKTAALVCSLWVVHPAPVHRYPGVWRTPQEQQFPRMAVAPWPAVRVGDSCAYPRDTTEVHHGR